MAPDCSARATWAAAARSRCSRSCWRRAGIAFRPIASLTSSGERSCHRTPPARFRPSSPSSAATSPRTASGRAGLVITEAEAYRFATDLVDLDLDGFDELLERSAHEPTRLARRSLEQ